MRHTFLSILLGLTVLSSAEEDTDPDLIPSSAEQVASLSATPIGLVGGRVNPITGALRLQETDLIAPGAEPIRLTRHFATPFIPMHYTTVSQHRDDWARYKQSPMHGGWALFGPLELQKTGRELYVEESTGMTLAFIRDQHGVYSIKNPSAGFHNVGPDGPGGRWDLRNTSVTFEGDGIILREPDGSAREYRQLRFGRYQLSKVRLSNGKILRYTHDLQTTRFRIESLDPQERFVYATIEREKLADAYLCRDQLGRQVRYELEKRFFQREWEERQGQCIIACGAAQYSKPLLVRVDSPSYSEGSLSYSPHFLLEDCDHQRGEFRCTHGIFQLADQPKQFRLHQLLSPLGPNHDDVVTHTLHYLFRRPGEGGCTRVDHKDGTSTRYYYSDNFLLEEVQDRYPSDAVARQTLYRWTDNNWLDCISIQDSEGSILHETYYDYDSFGNPINETLSGDLMGDGNTDSYAITREFSSDGCNLLLKEQQDNGLVTHYTYLPGTNLLTSKLICDGDGILQRSFWEYDDCYNLIRTIVDDGNSPDPQDISQVSERRLTLIHRRQEQSFLHLPEVTEERYYDGENERLLKRTAHHYDRYGNVCQEEVYDANGHLAYTLHREYDEAGRLLAETNALGQRATYAYDAKGRCIESTNFGGTLTSRRTFDLLGRCTHLNEGGSDGLERDTQYRYNEHDQLTKETNWLGHTTTFEYEPVTGLLQETQSPPVEGKTGPEPVISQSTIDCFGRVIATTDARGLKTRKSYTARDQPKEIVHPDGSLEQFRYYPDGSLQHQTDADRLTTQYTYDVLGRLTSRTYCASDGAQLAQETFTYRGYRLISETDKGGYRTTYHYDGAGRKIQENREGRIKRYQYDPLGNLALIIAENGDASLFTHHRYDLEGRLIETSEEDQEGHLLSRVQYAYDAQGNRTLISRSVTDDESINQVFRYDSFDRLVTKTDAIGHTTQVTFSKIMSPTTGLCLLEKMTTKPNGTSIVEQFDPYQHVVSRLVSGKTPLSASARFYDPCGNRVEQVDQIYADGQRADTLITSWEYDCRNRLIRETRAADTLNPYISDLTYTPSGRLWTRSIRGGSTLTHRYSPLGYLEELNAVGPEELVPACSYRYLRDRLGRLVSSIDNQTGTSTDRTLDPFGNVLREKLANGLAIEKHFDAFDRLLELVLPDGSTTRYSYDPLHPRAITRIDRSGQEIYTHTFDHYDYAGHLLIESLIDGLGYAKYAFDEKGRCNEISTTFWNQSIQDFDPDDNPTCIQTDDQPTEYTYNGLSQLTQEASDAYHFDSNHRLIEKQDGAVATNSLGQVVGNPATTCQYSPDGCLELKKSGDQHLRLTHDALSRLVAVSDGKVSVSFAYDALNRRTQKRVKQPGWFGWPSTSTERYFYNGDLELGAVNDDDRITQCRVLGRYPHTDIGSAVAVELDGQLFAPLHDFQGSVRRLVNTRSKSVQIAHDYTVFGEETSSASSPFNPWRYCSKRYDLETHLTLFGKRYHDASFIGWLTPDPAGLKQCMNPYSFCFNNPWRYCDPDGQFVFVIPLFYAGAWITTDVLIKAAIVSVAVSAAAYTGCQLAKEFNGRAPDFTFNSPSLTQPIYDSSSNPVWETRDRNKPPAKDHKEAIKQGWEDISHPDAAVAGKHTVRDPETGDTWRFDEGKEGASGHEGKDHWHRYNPNNPSGSKQELYLDQDGNPCPRGSPESHVY